MPDMFGFETPTEARQRIFQEMQERQQQQLQSGGQSPGNRVGVALSQIFGPMVKKTLETRADRKDLQAQLEAQGLSPEAAKAQAKASLTRDFSAARRAESLQNAQSEIGPMIDSLTPEVGPERAQATAMLYMSRKLRATGMHKEANELSLQAGQIMKDADIQDLKIKELKVGIASDELGMIKTGQEIDRAGQTSFMDLVDKREVLMAQVAGSKSPDERASYQRQLGAIEAKIAKDTAVTGRTEFDFPDKVFVRQQATEILDSTLLNERLGMADEALNDLSAFEASAPARWGVAGLSFMESYFSREPSESEKDFINRVVKAQGGSAYVAAQVRHALTGAQMSQFEIEYLTPFLPGPGDNKSKMKAKIAALRSYTQLDIDTRTSMLANRADLQEFFNTQINKAEPETPKPSITIGTPRKVTP